MPNPDFWRGKRVLLTGHTGFKGAWASAWLSRMGAEVHGFALAPDTEPNLASLLRLSNSKSIIGDIRDAGKIASAVAASRPHLVLHMAAQALVRRSYAAPVETFEANVNGTINLLDALRGHDGLLACLVITSDKVYENDGSGKAFVETDTLGGSDPYSASKAACEIATASFARSYFSLPAPPVATARAGNVIGGGDWSADRIVPDLWRAHQLAAKVELRYPNATRPWQHVLEPLAGYFDYLEAMANGLRAPTLNFGPAETHQVTVSGVVDAFQRAYGARAAGWIQAPGTHPKEAPTLAIDARRATTLLPWRPRLDAVQAIRWTAEWYAAFDNGSDMNAFTQAQIAEFEDLTA